MSHACPSCCNGKLVVAGRRHMRHYDYYLQCDWCVFVWPKRCGFDSTEELLAYWDKIKPKAD